MKASPSLASVVVMRAPGRRLSAVALALLAVALAVPIALFAAIRWVTAPGKPGPAEAEIVIDAPTDPGQAAQAAAAAQRVWPERPSSGEAAKRFLLDALLMASERLQQVDGYTATFIKQERIGGKLGRAQKVELKLRQRPFAVYLRYLEPDPGKEVVYCEGHFDNKMIAHGTGVTRRLLPRLAVAPTSPLALAENRHPITDAGIHKLTGTLLHYRRLDLTDPEAETILDRTTTADGRVLYRSIHTHPHRRPERPFARVEVLYDPETLFPIEITSFDWPESADDADLQLAEHYAYENLQLTESLTDLDFDPANPGYAFRRN